MRNLEKIAMILALTAMVSCGAEQEEAVTVVEAGSTYDVPSDEASVFSSEELGVRVEIPAGAVEEGTQLNIREAATKIALVEEDGSQGVNSPEVTISTTSPLLMPVTISISVALMLEEINGYALADDMSCEMEWNNMKAICDDETCEEEWMEAKAACDAITPEDVEPLITEGGFTYKVRQTTEDSVAYFQGEDVTFENEELTITTMELGTFMVEIGGGDEEQPNTPNPDDGTDTDDDGISDYEEVNFYDTDPNNPDTDGDGKTDGEEVASGELYPTLSYGVPVDELGEEPQGEDRDTDGDGVSDDDEMANGTNPQDASSF